MRCRLLFAAPLVVFLLACGGVVNPIDEVFDDIERELDQIPRAPVDAPETDDPPGKPADVTLTDDDLVVVRGSGDLVVVQYSDWQCGHCLDAYPKVRDAVRAAGGELRFRNFPLAGPCNQAIARADPARCLLAVGSICAHEDGRFEDWFGAVLEDDSDPYPALASDTFAACMAGETGANGRVTRQAATGTALGLMGTPTFFLRRGDGPWTEVALPDLLDALR
jgi:protein-disulfide isomerase